MKYIIYHICSFAYLFVRLFVRSLIRSFAYSFIHLFIRSFAYLFVHLFICSLICLFTYLFTYSIFILNSFKLHPKYYTLIQTYYLGTTQNASALCGICHLYFVAPPYVFSTKFRSTLSLSIFGIPPDSIRKESKLAHGSFTFMAPCIFPFEYVHPLRRRTSFVSFSLSN
jgi:hypothetical protein